MREHRALQLAQRLRRAADHPLGEDLGLGHGDMPEAEAGVGGKLRFLQARGVGRRLAIRQVREDGLEAERGCFREVLGLQRARHGELRRNVDDFFHGRDLQGSGRARMRHDMANHEKIAMTMAGLTQ